jgi:carboxymethylenebutenolidase
MTRGADADPHHRTTTTSTRSPLAFVSRPTSPPRALVAVLHPWWGLTPVMMGVCDDLAQRGYIAVAPDLYGGDLAATVSEAAALRARKRSTPMWRQIVRAIDEARSEHRSVPVGQIGFSMGGHWALWLAKQSRTEIPPIKATVVFYATRGGDFSGSESAFQFHLAEADPFVSPGSVVRQRRNLRGAGVEAEFHHYPATGHWFFEWDRLDAYDKDAADLAWIRTVKFLDRHLPDHAK